MTTLASIIREALNDVDRYKPDLKDSLRDAVEISKKAILHEEDLPIAGIRGPPGTGKTKVMEGLVHDEEVMDELLNGEYKFIYVAPTNELTTSGLARALRPIIKILGESGSSVNKILSKIRIYGSARPSPYFGNDLNELKKVARVSEDVLEKMVSGGIDDATFIFTTSYQSVSSKMRGSNYKFIPFVDEASKMPFHLPFNPFSDAQLTALAQGNPGVLHSLVIVGDERQAVAVGPEYQGYGKSLLALPKIEEILRRLGSKQFMTLDTTFRLPEPTQQPIGDGFYYDTGIQLRAIEDAQKRLGNRLRDIDWIEGLNRCRNLVSDKGNLWSKVIDSVESALSSFIPVIMVNTENFIKPGENSEPMRVKLAAYYALSLKCSLGNNVGISVIAPYIDLVEDTRYYLRKIGGANVNIRFLTVQSMLGGEDDIIISLLGKEWTKDNANYDEGETIYFIEPENLNVQLSRHRLMLIVIGSLQKLRNSAAKAAQRGGLRDQPTEASRIRRTIDSLLGLADISANENKQVRKLEPSKEGKHAIFMKVDQ
ncbi:MAG: hypothetical protein RXO24_04835 [Acidilobus sp.]